MLKLSGFWRNRNEEIAAIDLGSNSFHMIVAKVSNGQISIVDRLKEPVRLGYGLDDDGNLDDLSQRRALDCLERFHQRLKHLPPSSVRAVGTRTLRLAKNATTFLAKAEKALGFDIQIVPGVEEARLVYQGVAFGLEDDHQRRLVIDIGGGSTEIIIGEDFTPMSLESLGMGCVSVTKRFFDNGDINKRTVRAAEIFCLQKLEPVQHKFRKQALPKAIGCSGSIKSVSGVIEAMTGHPSITSDGIDSIVEECIKAGSIEKLNLPSLSNDRKPVFVGGLIVLKSVIHALKIETMESSPWALREGVLFDLLGHDSMSDMRERSVMELAKRFHADFHHAEKTNSIAQKLLGQIQKNIDIPDSWQRYLQWACLLQEIGIDINHDKFHVHGGYIVENSHLAGFGYDEQRWLAYLVRFQRKKPDWPALEALPADESKAFLIVLHIFRLACVLTRARNDIQDIGWAVSFENDSLSFSAPAFWWQNQPLATADLNAEINYTKKSPIALLLSQPIETDESENG